MARPRNPWEIVDWILRIAAEFVRLILEGSKLPW
jgi:hypothetical protein